MTGSARAVTLVVLLLAGAALLAPAVSADHVYSHRYVVMGRVVDADGHPVVGLAVPVGTTGFRKDGHCTGTSAASGTTDADGTFYYCLHSHGVDAGDEVRVRVAGAEYVKAADPDLRVTTFLVYAPTVNGTARDPAENRTYVVTGKVWQGTEEGLLDGVPVTGVALTEENVTVRLTTVNESGNATTPAVNATTDGFGEFVAIFDLPPGTGPVDVTVHAPRLNATRAFNASGTFLFTRADVAIEGDEPHPDVEPLPEQRPGEGAGAGAGGDDDGGHGFQAAGGDGAPGSAAPAFIGSPAFYFTTLGLAGVALVALAYVSKRERMREREREE